ncbi:MAG: Holliday junction branch migration protein RuvA [Candidatus Roizmanbacteria bacterium]
MIGKIRGSITEIDGDSGLIETASGVFYKVFLPKKLLGILLPYPIEIYIHLQVRDDALVLFGFLTRQDQQLFSLLLSVSGVGPKTAFTVASQSNWQECVSAIQRQDLKYFSQIPGLGKKTAMKILLELSQKLKTEFDFDKLQEPEINRTVHEALLSLGFRSQDIKEIAFQLSNQQSIEQQISVAIKLLTNKK